MANTKITTNVIADDAVTSDKLGGDLTMPGHVSLADNKELRIGTGNDLVIKHDGSHTTLTNTTGNFTLLGDAVYIGNAANNEYLAQFIANGAASLRYDNTEQLATVSGGVYIPNELGIGTNSPTQKLDILGSSTTLDIGADDTAEVVAQFVPDSTDNRNGRLRIAGTTSPHNNSIALISDSSTNVGMAFVTTSSGTKGERMVITSAGNVGIGTNSPSTTYDKQLHINASGTGASLKLTDSGSGTGASDGAEVIMYNTNMYVTNREAANMFLQTSANTRMTIDSAGKVGIGAAPNHSTLEVTGDKTTANNLQLTLRGATNTNKQLIMGFDTTTDKAYITSQIAGSAQKPLIINADKVGIGIDTPGGLPLQTKVSSGDNKLRMTTANKDAFILELRDASGDVWLGTHTTAGAIQIGDAGQVNMPSQPVASYGHAAGSEAGGYSYNFGGTGSVSVICKPTTAIINRGSMYNSSTGRFTAPKAGIYRYAVHGNLYTLYLADGAYFMIQIRKNGGHYVYHYEVNEANSSSWLYNNMGGVISMAKDDYLEFRLVSNNMSGGASGGFGWDASSYTHYEFHLLY